MCYPSQCHVLYTSQKSSGIIKMNEASHEAHSKAKSTIMKLKCTIPKPTPMEWIRLQSGKEFSRLLYTNPVCFLSTTTSSQPEPLQNADRDIDGKVPAKKTDSQPPHNNIKRNVMVLSWLTASNNNGRFLFSIHKTRYSTQLLTRRRVDESDASSCKSNYEVGAEFTLSVPVKGMEEIVKDVGSISGRCCSKFQSVRTTSLRKECLFSLAQPPEDMYDNNLSNRQRKKRKKDYIKNNGIYDLIPVPLGSDDEDALRESDLFAIKGTVAHLRCRVYALLGPQFSNNLDATNEKESSANTSTQPAIDDDHLLIMAEVIDAYVNSSYWDSTKLLFRPMTTEGEQTVPPYLTFFGSQTFGYVVPSNDEM